MESIRRALGDALGLVFPVNCSGCGAEGDTVCDACRVGFVHPPERRRLEGLSVWSAAPYAGEAARVLAAFKDSGRRDARHVLGVALGVAVAAALAEADADPIRAVPIPSGRAARIRRGYHPVEVIARAGGVPVHRALRPARRVADQRRLSADERRSNRQGAVVARRRLDGWRVLLLDDVVTTGATLEDAAQAVRRAGGEVVGAATVAATPLFRHAS